MIEAILEYAYMRNAFFSAILASIICGIIGTIIVEKKLVSMSGGIAHASFGGIGAGYFFGVEPILGGIFFALASALGVSSIRRKSNIHADTIINMFWSAGMAIGILFISLTPGYPPDMESYLFGNILTVNNTYLQIMVVLSILIFLSFITIFNYWKIYLFDEEYAKIIGMNIVFFEKFLYVLIALSVVVLIKVVGIILAIAMFTIPPAISKMFFKELKIIMISSTILGMIFSLVGLTVSYYIDNIPSGATIIIVSIIVYFICMLVKRVTGNERSEGKKV